MTRILLRPHCAFSFACVLAFSFAYASLCNVVEAEDWLQWRGQDRANHSPETGLFEAWPEDGPELAWMAEGLGSGYANVSVAGNRIYTSGDLEDSQSVIAVDATDGSILWKTAITESVPKHGYPGSRTTPTIDDNRLYMVSSDGKIVCLDVSNGDKIWSRDFSDWNGKMMSGWGFSESPLVDGNKVICTPGGDKGMVVALDKTTGEEIWVCTMSDPTPENDGKPLKEGAGYSSPIITNGGGVKQYVQLVGRGLIGIRAEDGKLLWQYNRVANDTANVPTAVIDGEYVFTSTGYNTGSALLKLVAAGTNDVDVEEVYWLTGRTLQNKHGGMTLIDGYIYCGHGNGQGMPTCVDMATGEITWGPERAKGKGEASLIHADGHILYRREDGTIMLTKVNPEELEIVSVFEPAYQEGKSWAHPVIADGKLYLREQDKLMCYKLKAN
ncbi:PQQ-binding-like beta-propeller repeat protein [Novipirellula artificiosorum]|uniref:Outer membrane biogenesis protein BamB n=1 Tax=Novipirellula artificiosorum TaxID=2528016 RepID=A0A5C6D9E2_9BACT|nr:PQQ-binding-like beta-propeller repeat protein [Novipirellula artificiosorum]TWU33368.1 outer membrane biogenesis protein BamB [Novipirellula artificiosorum]